MYNKQNTIFIFIFAFLIGNALLFITLNTQEARGNENNEESEVKTQNPNLINQEDNSTSTSEDDSSTSTSTSDDSTNRLFTIFWILFIIICFIVFTYVAWKYLASSSNPAEAFERLKTIQGGYQDITKLGVAGLTGDTKGVIEANKNLNKTQADILKDMMDNQ